MLRRDEEEEKLKLMGEREGEKDGGGGRGIRGMNKKEGGWVEWGMKRGGRGVELGKER